MYSHACTMYFYALRALGLYGYCVFFRILSSWAIRILCILPCILCICTIILRGILMHLRHGKSPQSGRLLAFSRILKENLRERGAPPKLFAAGKARACRTKTSQKYERARAPKLKVVVKVPKVSHGYT